jgi:hypothetical protein
MSRTLGDIQRGDDARIVAKAESNSAAFAAMRAALSNQFAAAIAENRSSSPVEYDENGEEIEIWLLGDPVGSKPI